MRYDRNYAYFRPHFDWYTFVPGTGYVPNDNAPEDAKEAMRLYNSYTFGTKYSTNDNTKGKK